MGVLLAVLSLAAALVGSHQVSAEKVHEPYDGAEEEEQSHEQREAGIWLGKGFRKRSKEHMAVLNTYDCPYALSKPMVARHRGQDPKIPGNVLKVQHFRFGRTGNRFMAVYRNLALGYCCKSKLVWFPPKDEVLAPGFFNEGTPGPRGFDFSSAPDVEGFNSSTCTRDIEWKDRKAMKMEPLKDPARLKYVPKLNDCIKKAPRLTGCEAAYFFPRDITICPAKKHNSPARKQPDQTSRGFLDKRETASRESLVVSSGSEGRNQINLEGSRGDEKADGVGNLVIHVRSGDIFFDRVVPYKGQPPLYYYMLLMREREWEQIDIVTNGLKWSNLNPVVPALITKKERGELPSNVNIHTERSMGDDLRTMLCADNLAMAKSSLIHLLGFHSTAARLYYPWKCDPELRKIARLHPETKVYGLQLGPSTYSVYDNWENTPHQRAEMLEYNSTATFEQCSGDHIFT